MVIAISVVILLNVMGLAWCYLLQSDKLTDLIYSLSFAIIAIIFLFINTSEQTNHFIYFLIIIWAIRLGSYLFTRIHHMGNDQRFEKMRRNYQEYLSFGFSRQLVSSLLPYPCTLQTNTAQVLFFTLEVYWLVSDLS